MSEQSGGQRAALTKALRLIRDLKARLEQAQTPEHVPVAVIGMGCRFPGASTPDAFWRLLRDGVDAVRKIPQDRWDHSQYYAPDPKAPGKTTARHGSFLDDVADFDPHFFGISSREALSLDPQQRLLLEVAWEALADAGLPPDSLEGRAAGVYVGLGRLHGEYAATDPGRMGDHHLLTGNDTNAPAGRISYLLGLQGPSMVVSTACSSSLVATALATQALREGRCDLALAGGVQLNLSPELFLLLGSTGALSPDGRCRAFDADANGYVRGEGCGVVVLKRLDDALADGDPVHAVIRGVAVNHDGTSAGLTVPNGESQRKLLLRAMADAQIPPEQIGYIEAHGTGTPLGDPIEIRAIGRAIGQRPTPLRVGTVKSNLGHLENAAGVAGLIKLILCVQRGEIPRSLHFDTPNAHIPWDELPVEVVTEHSRWADALRIGGVSAFGFSGTNAHVIVGQAPERVPGPAAAPTPGPCLFPLSAHTPAALSALAARWLDRPADGASLADLCATAALGRAHLRHRAGLVVADEAELREGLAALAADPPQPTARRPRIAFLFTGQGAQALNMGRELYRREPVFARALDRCDALLRPRLERPLLSLMFGEGGASAALHRTDVAQPALFSMGYALTRLWAAWGIQPDAVLGHSIGELLAACVAGVVSLEDGLALVAERGRLMAALPGGAMLAVAAGEATLAPLVEQWGLPLSIAAINGPESVVLSGEIEATRRAASQLEALGIATKPLTVSHAFHSPMMEPVVSAFRQFAGGLEHAAPRVTWVSNLDGQPVPGGPVDPARWGRHIRAPVRFYQGLQTLLDGGYDCFVEIGPKPTLCGMARRAFPDAGVDWLPSIRPGRSERAQVLATLARLYTRGRDPVWSAVNPAGQKVRGPAVPYQRSRYWMADHASPRARRAVETEPASGLIDRVTRSPLLRGTLFEASLSLATHPFLADHVVLGQVVVPGACHLAVLFEAAALSDPDQGVEIRDLVFPAPLVLPEHGARRLQLLLRSPSDDGWSEFELISLEGQGHTTHAIGRLRPRPSPGRPTPLDVEALERELPSRVAPEAHYAAAHLRHYDFGPHFRWIKAIHHDQDRALGWLSLDPPDPDLPLHPGFLDAAFQLTDCTHYADAISAPDSARLPFSATAVFTWPRAVRAGTRGWGRVLRTGPSQWDIHLTDDSGLPLVELRGFTVRAAPRIEVAGRWRRWLYQPAWQPDAFQGEPVRGARLLVLDDDEEVASELAAMGFDPVRVSRGATFRRPEARHVQLDPHQPSHWDRLLREESEVDGIVSLWGAATPSADRAPALLEHTLLLLQALVRAGDEAPALLLSTRRAQSVEPGEPVTGLAGAGLWGLGRVARREHPELSCRLLDLEDTGRAAAPAIAAALGDGRAGEDLAIRRGGVPHVLRLLPLQAPDATPGFIRRDASYLISGGLGHLGRQLAAVLAEQGAGQLILMGRRPPDPATAEQLGALERHGVRVRVVSADVCEPEAVARILRSMPADLPLRGVFHAAGVLDDGILMQQSPARLYAVLAPKVLGAINLHRGTADQPLDAFVLFSSTSGLLGNPGQSSYAAANAFLDTLAAHRRSQGLPALSVDWGAFAGAGMAAGLAASGKLRRDDAIPPAEGFEALLSLLGSTQGQVAVVPTPPSQWFGGEQPPPVLARLALRAGPEPKTPTVSLRARWLAARPEDRPALLEAHIAAHIARALGESSIDHIDPETELVAYGLDSLGAIELRGTLQDSLEIALPATLLFRHPTRSALTRHLSGALSAALAPRVPLESEEDTTVRPLQRDGLWPPLWFVSGAAGPVFNLLPLARALGEARPFFALETPGYQDPAAQHTTIEAIAAHHVRDLMEVQPRGPFLLGGFSTGAKVAFEIAQQLHRAGHRVELVVLIDIPFAPSSTDYAAAPGYARHIRSLADARGLPREIREDLSLERMQTLTPSQQVTRCLEALHAAGTRIRRSELERILALYRATTSAEATYQPREIHPLPLLLFKARELHPEIAPLVTPDEPGWGWTPACAGPLHHHEISGGHFTMIVEPHVQEIARVLLEHLRRVTAKEPT